MLEEEIKTWTKTQKMTLEEDDSDGSQKENTNSDDD